MKSITVDGQYWSVHGDIFKLNIRGRNVWVPYDKIPNGVTIDTARPITVTSPPAGTSEDHEASVALLRFLNKAMNGEAQVMNSDNSKMKALLIKPAPGQCILMPIEMIDQLFQLETVMSYVPIPGIVCYKHSKDSLLIEVVDYDKIETDRHRVELSREEKLKRRDSLIAELEVLEQELK